MTDLKSLNIEEIQDFVVKHNFPKYRAEQIFRWINTGVSSFDEMKNIPKDLRSKLSEYYYISVVNIEKKQVSSYDNTVKYLFKFCIYFLVTDVADISVSESTFCTSECFHINLHFIHSLIRH